MFSSRQSRHDGVSCDSCLKGNFRGRRFKCLVCYDYDLCSSCYEVSYSLGILFMVSASNCRKICYAYLLALKLI